MTIEGPRRVEGMETKEGIFQAWVEGNLRFPQTAFGMNILVSDAVVNDEPLDLVKFASSKLTDKQLATLKVAMNRAHAAKHIPAGSAESLPG